MVTVAPHVVHAILAAARNSPDREICGLLTGTQNQITDLAPSPNRHPDPARGFAICDALYARTQRRMREEGLFVIGCYHSHPSGGVAPSETDRLAVQEDGFVWVIASPQGDIAAWRAIARPPVKGFEPIEIAHA